MSFFCLNAVADSCEQLQIHGKMAVEKMDLVSDLAQYSKNFSGDRLCKELESIQEHVEHSMESAFDCYADSAKKLKRVERFEKNYLETDAILSLCVEKPDRYNTVKSIHIIKSDFKLLF